MAVVGERRAQILLDLGGAAARELRDGAHGRGLEGAGRVVAIGLRVKDADLHLVAANEDVVEAEVADAVGPAVTTNAYGELPGEALKAQDLELQTPLPDSRQPAAAVLRVVLEDRVARATPRPATSWLV